MYSDYNLVMIKSILNSKNLKKNMKSSQWSIEKVRDIKVKENFETVAARSLREKDNIDMKKMSRTGGTQ